MGTLAGAMSIATGAVLAQEEALQITAENVANANTAGYTRKRPVLEQEPAYFNGQYMVGRGVTLAGSESLRDRVLELRLATQQQTQGKLDAYVTAMSPVELMFTGTADLGSAIDSFFSAMSQLSADPTNSSLRQTVLSAAASVVQNFQSDAADLTTTQASLNENVVQTTQKINSLTQQIALLNPEVSRQQKLGQDTGTYEDERTALVQQLSQLANVDISTGDDGITVTTASGTPLVVGNQAYALTTARDASTGLEQVFNGATNVTADFTGGSMGGTLEARDQDIPALLNSLDTFAYNFANQINAAHSAGYDLNGATGVNLFAAPAAVAGAAANLKLAITEPSQVAASGDASAGGNANLTKLLAVADTAIANGQTPSQYYAGLVFQAGNLVAQATAQQTASTAMLGQLQKQRDAFSGVSLDEEATNLMQYQRAFQAAARVVNALDDCLQAALQIGAH